MPDTIPIDKKIDFLWNIFRNVNSWLEFAEKKNLHLSTFLGVSTLLAVAAKELFPNTADYALLRKFVLISSTIILSLSWIICIFSFYPRTAPCAFLATFGTDRKLGPKDNLLFYGDIAKYSHDELLQAFKARYDLAGIPDSVVSDICGQILQNSDIAYNKFQLFKRGLTVQLLGFLGLILFFCIPK